MIAARPFVLALSLLATGALGSACEEGHGSPGSPIPPVGSPIGGVSGSDGAGAGSAGFSGAGGAPAACINPAISDTTLPRARITFDLDWRYRTGDETEAEAKDHDDSGWEYVDLPHTTRFVTPEAPSAYLGISWYRKHFALGPAEQGRKVFLEFEAAMQSADVWVNGQKKLRHEGGYTPFTVDVTDQVTYDGTDNVIALKLDSNANPNWAPGWNGVDFQYHGGLYRDVTLHLVNRLHVTDAVYADQVAGGGVFVTYPVVNANSATVAIQTHVANEYPDAKATTLLSELVDADGTVVGSAADTVSIEGCSARHFVQTLIVRDPKLWHPYAPNLYTLRTTVSNGAAVVDDCATRIGIRRIEWSHDGGLVINGSRFRALGVNLHQEIYGLGNAVPNRSIYYDVQRVKQGGMDFIRGSHYPHDPAFYDACDELGVLVLDAQTGWQRFANTPEFKNSTYRELRDLVRRDRNHPSVVAWEASLNESNFTDDWAQAAHAIVHEEYPGDQAYSAAWKWSRADLLIGASQHGVRNSADARPILISEYGDWDYGGASSTSRQAREAGDRAMLTQADNVEDGTSKNLALPWFSAGNYWGFADYAGFTNYGITRCGLVDMYRMPKHAYYFLQSQRDATVVLDGVDSGPMVYIANQWTADSPTTVRVYHNCEQVSLSLDGAPVATLSPDANSPLPHPPLDFELTAFTPGVLLAECLIGGAVQATFARKTPGAATAVRLSAEATLLEATPSDARLVFIQIVDAEGTVVPTDGREVSLSIEGPGSIVGPALVTLRGGELATWVRASRTPGTITLSAGNAALTAGTLTLTSRATADLPPAPADRSGE